MPIVQISLVEGRDLEAVKRCAKAVARAVHESLDAPLSAIRVTVQQVPPAFWTVGARTRDEMDAERQAATDAADESSRKNSNP